MTVTEGILVIAATYLFARAARGLTKAAARNLRLDLQLVLLAGRLVYVGVVVLGLLAFLYVVASGLVGPVLGAVGLLGLAFGLAFQDVLKNFLSGVFLLLERPFLIGDEIKVGEFSGRVETILLRVTVLKTADGLRVLLPNQQVYTSAIVNNTGYSHRRFVGTVTLPSNVALEAAVTSAGEALPGVKGVAAEPPPRVSLLPRAEGGSSLEVRYWIDYRSHDIAAVQAEVNAMLLQIGQQGTGSAAEDR